MREVASEIVIQADFAAVEAAQEAAELRNHMRRHMERMARIKAWQDPEAIKRRKEQHEKDAAAALELGKSLARDYKLLPVPDPLPPEMVGQSPSTIQAMLRHKLNE